MPVGNVRGGECTRFFLTHLLSRTLTHTRGHWNTQFDLLQLLEPLKMASTRDFSIESALDAYRNGEYNSIRKVARLWNVSEATLRRRLKGAVPKPQAHVTQQLLTSAQEELLVQWILSLEATGYPPAHMQVKEMVRVILRCSGIQDPAPVGEQWIRRFRLRNPQVATLLSRKMDSQRIEGTSESVLRE